MCFLTWTRMRQINSIRACSPQPCPSAILPSPSKPPEGAASAAPSFFRNLGDIRTARTKQRSVQGSKARLEGPVKDGHQSRKSGGADSAVLWDCEESRGGGEVSAEATVLVLILMGLDNEKIPRCGTRDGHRTGGEGSFASRCRQIVGRPTSHRPGC